ncbi:MAG: DUF4145 domain-containing protein [Flavobacteriales bacterium]|nr:DUF4145 domain-containing protein [Flavobacteriales bacterium]
MSPCVPEAIRACFYEAQQCYQNYHYRAASVLCRAVLELTAKEKGVTQGNLEKKIDKLRELNLLNDDLHLWAHQIRFFGNRAAHDLDPGTDHTDAKDALDLVKAILDYVYSLRDKFERFKQNRESKPHS